MQFIIVARRDIRNGRSKSYYPSWLVHYSNRLSQGLCELIRLYKWHRVYSLFDFFVTAFSKGSQIIRKRIEQIRLIFCARSKVV